MRHSVIPKPFHPALAADALPLSRRGVMPSSLIHLDPGLPPRMSGRQDLVWAFSGWACRPGARLRAVEVVVAGTRFAAAELGTVRLDADAAQRRQGWEPANPASGFWGLAALPPSASGGELLPVLRVEWTDGTLEEWPAGRVRLDAAAAPILVPSPQGTPPLVAIAMATYNPDPVLFQAQVASIRAQTHGHWICLVEDDGSDDAHWRVILDATAGDDRFRVRRNDANLGFYRNFERALARVPPEAAFVALADQDDRWAPDKVASLMAALDEVGAVLAFANMRVVDRAGRLLSATFWPGLDSRCDSLDALLMANAVTGCACLFRASLLRLALPFPALGRTAYHDHWIACCAAASGTIVYRPQPMGDYVQHEANSLGYQRRPGLRLAVKALSALLLVPVVSLAGQSAAVRRWLARPLGLLVDMPESELVCRVAFAETLRRRTELDGAGRRAVATFLPGPRPTLRLLAAFLRTGRRGRAFRGVAARLIVGRLINGLMGALARRRRPTGIGAGASLSSGGKGA